MRAALQLATLLIVAWLPGAALYRAPLLRRERREALSAEERAFWAVILSAAFSLGVVLLLAWLERYTFERLLLVNTLFSGAVAVIWRTRLRMPHATRVTATALVPVVLLLIGAWRFFPPAEYIMGGKDPGVYINEGIQLAQRGSLLIRDRVIDELPPFAHELFVPQHFEPDQQPRMDYYGTRFMGFFVRDIESGTVVGQFPHLFPAAVAIGYGIDGLTGARRTTTFWALAGMLAVYFAGARLFGRLAAGVGVALLALHVLQVWYARYPNAEVLMQAMVFAIILATARAHMDDVPFFAPVAGTLLGLLLFLRFDSVLVVAAVTAALAVAAFDGKRVRLTFVAAFALTAAVAIPYMLGPMSAYVDIYLRFFGRVYWTWQWWQYVAALSAAAVGAALFWFVLRVPTLSSSARAVLPSALAALVLAAGLYALFLREPGGKLAAQDAYALRTFANVYFTVPAVLAALLGFSLTARQRFWRDPALFIVVALFSFVLFYKIRIVPEHFWLGRRFVPVILPGALLFVAAAAFATAGHQWRARIVRWSIGGIFVALLGLSYMRTSEPVVQHVEYAGLIPHLERLASRFEDDDLVIVEGRDAQSDVHVLALPLAYIYARNVLLLPSARPDKADMAAFIEWARTRYRNVFFLGGGGTDLLSHSYGLAPAGGDRFQVPEFETTRQSLPRRAHHKEFEYGLYRFVEPTMLPGAWFDLDIGTNDDLHVLRFHSRETTGGRTFRWTRARSFVSVTTITPASRELTLVLADGGRPPAAPPAEVEVFLHNQKLASLLVTGDFKPYPIPIPPELAASAAAEQDPVELRLITRTWQPSGVLGSPDDRELGVMVDRITIK